MLELVMALHLGDPLVVPMDKRRLRIAATRSIETPLPAELTPTSLLDVGTGSLSVTPDVGDLVRSANDYVRALAVIPIDAEAEDVVDGIVAERVQGIAKKRKLRRR